MEDNIQTIIIQITTITILLIGLLLVVITFIASVKRQIQEKALFDLELVFLQKKIDQQILEINTCRNNYDNTWSGYRKFTIQKKEIEKNSGVCSFYLVPHDGKAIPGFSPPSCSRAGNPDRPSLWHPLLPIGQGRRHCHAHKSCH